MVQAAGGAEGDSTPSEKTVQKKMNRCLDLPVVPSCVLICWIQLDHVGSLMIFACPFGCCFGCMLLLLDATVAMLVYAGVRNKDKQI